MGCRCQGVERSLTPRRHDADAAARRVFIYYFWILCNHSSATMDSRFVGECSIVVVAFSVSPTCFECGTNKFVATTARLLLTNALFSGFPIFRISGNNTVLTACGRSIHPDLRISGNPDGFTYCGLLAASSSMYCTVILISGNPDICKSE